MYELENLCSFTEEGKLLPNPSNLEIEEVFASLQNYKFFVNAPLILETFN